MSGQEKKEMEKREKAKTTKIQRIRKRLHLTINPENYEFIRNSGSNASGFMDTPHNEFRSGIKPDAVFILENKALKWTRGDSNARSLPCEGNVMTS